jgi:hypothetical protein
VDVRELYERGLELRRSASAVSRSTKRMNALGEVGEPLQNIVNAYAYGGRLEPARLLPVTVEVLLHDLV